MPIKGLTDRGASFPIIGTIRKGKIEHVKTKTREYDKPVDLEYFRVEFDEREQQTAALFRSFYGDEPDAINVVLPFASVIDNFDAFDEAYVKRGLVFRGDGERVLYERDGITDEVIVSSSSDEMRTYKRGEAVGHYVTGNGEKKPIVPKPIGRLKVMLDAPMPPRLAYLVAKTGSTYDIGNLTEQLNALSKYGERGLVGIPLVLRRRPVEIAAPIGEGGSRVRVTKWLLSIEASPEWVMKRRAIAAAESLPQLPPGVVEGEVRVLEAPSIEDEDESFIEQAADEATDEVRGVDLEKPVNAFWHTVRTKTGLTTEDAEQIVTACGGDFTKALKKVREQHVPPEAKSS